MYTMITDESVHALVDIFYRHIRADEKLAPIFDAAIGTTNEEWPPHLERITKFWSGVMLGTKDYDGKPLQAHKELPAFDPGLFSRWLALFANAAIETHEVVPATAFIRKSVSIADMMARDLFGRGLEMPAMPKLPDSMAHYRTTPPFKADTIPVALRRAHRTAAGVYARIVVSQGRLFYTIGKEQCHILTPDNAGVIEPEAFHFVTPLDDAAFTVEFYKDPLSLSKGASSS